MPNNDPYVVERIGDEVNREQGNDRRYILAHHLTLSSNPVFSFSPP